MAAFIVTYHISGILELQDRSCTKNGHEDKESFLYAPYGAT